MFNYIKRNEIICCPADGFHVAVEIIEMIFHESEKKLKVKHDESFWMDRGRFSGVT
jgi:hypothetical protein